MEKCHSELRRFRHQKQQREDSPVLIYRRSVENRPVVVLRLHDNRPALFRKSNLESRKASSLTKPASAQQTLEESSWPQGLGGPLIGQKLLQFLKRFSFGGQRVAGPPLLNRCERNAKLGGNLLLCVSSFGGEVFELLNESTKLFFFSCETSGLSLVKRVSFWHTLGPNAGSRIPCARWS